MASFSHGSEGWNRFGFGFSGDTFENYSSRSSCPLVLGMWLAYGIFLRCPMGFNLNVTRKSVGNIYVLKDEHIATLADGFGLNLKPEREGLKWSFEPYTK